MNLKSQQDQCSQSGYPDQQVQPQPPPWADCSIEQKIERLRVEVMNTRQFQKWNRNHFEGIETRLGLFEHHQHGIDGTVLVRPRDVERGYGVTGAVENIYDPLA